MQLKIKIDLVTAQASPVHDRPASFDVVKIRNFLLLLALLSCMICTMAFSMWPVEPSQPFVEPTAVAQLNNDDNVGIIPIIMDDEAPPRQPDIVDTPSIENDVEAISLDDPTYSFLALNDIADTDNTIDAPAEKEVIIDVHSEFVNRAQLTLAMAQREPIDNVSTLSLATQKQLFFFTQISQKKDQMIYHRWMFNNKLMAQIKLNIGGNQWRTYSSKTFNRQMLGQWQVDVVDDNNQILTSVEFDVTH